MTAVGEDSDCPFVSTEAVQEVFGAEMELRAAGEGCVFTDGELNFQFTHIDILIDPEQYADEALEASCDEGTAVEVDAGDRAYACVSFVGPLANLYEGEEVVVINTSGAGDGDEEAVRDSLAELLPHMSTG